MPKTMQLGQGGSCPQVTNQEALKIFQDERDRVRLEPFDLIDSQYLHIKTKAGDLIPLHINAAQRLVYDLICQLRAEKKPVRIWILKFRQGGVSTVSEATLYCLTSQQENRNSLIMADEVDKSNYLFEMTKLYQEKLAEKKPFLAPKLKKSNEKKLEFQDIHSQIIIDTAQNVNAARAYTYQYVHLSEVSRFRYLREVMDALMQSIPDHWDTIVLGETTANGLDNEFYTEWQKAKKGESDWIPLFLGWYIMPEYSRPLGVGGQLYPLTGVQFDTDGGEKDFLKEEELLQRQHNLTNEQLNWRRWCIKNKCGGQVRTFRQEYPSNDEEAFLTSGSCVFDTLKLKNQKLNASVKAIGTLFEDITGRVVFRKEVNGKFRLFQEIGKNIEAVIGADVAEGVGGNQCAACALDRRTNNTIMGYVGDTDPDEFAKDLRLIGLYLNKALIAPENNSLGYATCSVLEKIYPKVFKQEVKTKDAKPKVGWTTDKRTRPQMVSHLIEEIREDSTELRDPILVDQCLSFVRKPNGKVEAQDGKQDDYVIARMIAGQLRALYPFYSKAKTVKESTHGKRTRKQSHSGKSPGY